MPVSFDEAEPLLRIAVTRGLEKLGISPPDSAVAEYVRGFFDRENGTFCSSRKEGAAAVAEFHRLKWDSGIYGTEIAGVSSFALTNGESHLQRALTSELASDLVASARDQGLRMLVARVALSDLLWIQALEEQGFKIMDVQCPLGLVMSPSKADRADVAKEELRIRDFEGRDLPEILSFAKTAFGQSHLYADLLLPAERTDQLYEAWIRNDCLGRASFVLVALLNDRICGLVAGLWDDLQENSLEIKHGHIDLIAVRNDARQLGIGRMLMGAAMRRYAERGAMLVTVSTQATNLAAINLYQRIGFKLTGFEVTLHGWV